MGSATWSRERNREQSAIGCPSCSARSTSSNTNDREAVAKKSLHHAIIGIGEARVHGQVCRMPAFEVGIDAGGPQRGVPQHRTVEAGERESVLEPVRKKVRFAERVVEQTPEGVLVRQAHRAPAAAVEFDMTRAWTLLN